MYCYRIPKDLWWPLAAACRDYYHQNHPLVKAAKQLAEKGSKYSEYIKLVDALVEEGSVTLQIFDEGDTYLIRVLESGWFFLNNFEKWAVGLQPVFFDNRSDVSPEEEKNRPVADWLDQQIREKRYFLHPIMDKDAYKDLYFDAYLPAGVLE